MEYNIAIVEKGRHLRQPGYLHRRENMMPEKENKNSDARIRANNKYNDKAYDRINIAVPKGKKAEIQAAADAAGESVNAYIKKAVELRLESGT